MRLYVPECRNCSHKVYLDIYAETRGELRGKIGDDFQLRCDHCGHIDWYSVNEVQAEKGIESTPAGTIIGGAIGGITGGPIGALIGAVGGTVLGATADEQEKQKVERFNNSY